MNPMAACFVLLNEELIIVSLGAIRDIQQDRRIPDSLLKARHMDIHRTTRQMVTRRSTPSQLIHLW